MTETKVCKTCNTLKPHTDFHSCERQRIQSRCKTCKSVWAKAHYAKNPEVRSRLKWARYGLTEESRNALRASQDNRCGLCVRPLEGGMKEHVDHCHETGVTRSILCSECNTGMGKLKDSPELLRKAADYIESYLT